MLYAANILFGISTLLLVIHISYGGWFIMTRVKKTGILTWLIILAIAASLLVMIFNIASPVAWLSSLICAFILAILFHLLVEQKAVHVYLREFCHYKIFIEAYGIILALSGLLFYALLPEWHTLLAAFTFYFVLRLNHLIFIRKNLYNIKYPDVAPLSNPLVSIVVIAYNEEKFIRKALESIEKQTYKNFEVIVVDDHSTDKTVPMAQSFRHKFPLKIVQKEIRGCSRSRNFGAKRAKGEIILFLDADVVLPPDMLEKNLQTFVRENLSCAFFDFEPITDKKIDRFVTSLYRAWLKIVQYFNPRGPGFFLMVRKNLHEKILFDENIMMCEDFEYVKRAIRDGKFRIIDHARPLVSWRRFEKENRLKLVLKYLFFEFYRQNIGEMRKPVLAYEFGRYGTAERDDE